MRQKLLKNKRGSTLILVLMSLFVLSIVGTSIISLSVMNYKMKKLDQKQKTSFYLAEAGLEEAYGIMQQEIKNGMQKGNENVENYTKNELPSFIASERSRELREIKPEDSPFIKSNGSVDEENIKIILKKKFIEGYTNYFNTKDKVINDKNFLMIKLENQNYYTDIESDLESNSSKPEIKVDEDKMQDYKNKVILDLKESGIKNDVGLNDYKKTIEDYLKNVNSKFKISLTSQFNHESIKKNIKSTFTISIPEYDKPYYIENKVFKLKENVLWSKALTSEKDIIVSGKDVKVNGDIYAYGHDNAIYKKGTDKLGVKDSGIKVPGNLIVNGNVITGGYFQTDGSDSNIQVNKGQIFCNSLVIPENASNSKIDVIGDVNTFDDIELNGLKSNIDIKGNYYGFSRGEIGNEAGKGHGISSSIVINSDDIGKESGITIKEDNEWEKKRKEKNIKNSYSDYYQNGVFITGTVYIDLDTDDSYQTGEGVSIKGNYQAYTKKIEREENKSHRFYTDKVKTEYKSPLELVVKYTDENGIEKDFRAEDLAEYIQKVKEEEDSKKKDNPEYTSFFELGGPKIDIDNVKFSTGAYVSKGKFENASDPSIFGRYKTDFDKNKKEYDYYVNRMGDPQINLENLLIQKEIPDYLKNQLKISDLFSFENADKEISRKPELKPLEVNEDSKVAYVNTNSTNIILLSGLNSSSKEIIKKLNSKDIGEDQIKDIQLKSSIVDGIIVTKGDIYISGEMNFTGTIIAEGNIYIEDNNPKTFNNRYDNEVDFAKNYVVRKVVEDKNTKDIQIGDLFVQNPTWTKETKGVVYNSTAGVDSNVNTYYKFNDLIDITQWKEEN